MSRPLFAAVSITALAVAAAGACGKGSDGPRCPDGTTECPSGQCADLMNDQTNCGTCGNACGAGTCVGGACICAEAAVDCGGPVRCVDTSTDPAHCGDCSTRCLPGESCAGRCECVSPKSLCPADGPTLCTDLSADRENCGSCGTRCTNNHVCASGTCVCPAAQPSECSDTCVNLQTNASHCGACGTACAAGHVCLGGLCACPAGQVECNGACIDPKIDRSNCGSCGNACASDRTCSSGRCSCPLPKTECSGACVDTQSDPSHCGSCANRCTGTTPCRAGLCCPSGRPVCGATCCAGGAGCCTGDTCPASHSNGLGSSFFDCAPLATPGNGTTYSVELARSAANAWNPSGTDTAAFPCGGGFCFARQAAGQCAVWCYGGMLSGRVHANPVGIACICPTQADPTWK